MTDWTPDGNRIIWVNALCSSQVMIPERCRSGVQPLVADEAGGRATAADLPLR